VGIERVSDTVIRVENLGKKYIIGHQKQQPYTALRDVIADGIKSFRPTLSKPFGRKIFNPAYEEFWALKNISFEVNRGDRIGIIGRNGAGKSTLLKILSRITEPTIGRISIKGRVASLLEVGTGFHPELTGRENIYLNGAILGMSKREIKNKFDEMVAFAEVEKFLDTPVKHYSSGMYVRLAFAVAAHLDPEILVVDEVLAVGDAKFQNKCLGKMKDVSGEGRTVLFVSHQMGMLAQLCNQAILLQKGEVIKQGKAQETISYYLDNVAFNESNSLIRSSQEKKEFFITRAETVNQSDQYVSDFGHIYPITLKIKFQSNKYVEDAVLGVTVKDLHGRKIFISETVISSQVSNINNANWTAKMKIPAKLLVPGHYYCGIAIYLPNVKFFDRVEEVCRFTITDMGSEFAKYEGQDYGCIFANCVWEIF
jgi:lipopolysaccharide transport system ATP-binding protein